MTPVQRRGNIWIKRDDLYSFGGVHGGKVRTCRALARGAYGLVTAGSRSSPQIHIVAAVARKLGIPCRAHTPMGELSYALRCAEDLRAVIIQHPHGRNSVIKARARDDAEALGWKEIPFGMECEEAVTATAAQVESIRAIPASRIVVAVGSGMSLAGILHGMKALSMDIPVLGIRVGADPVGRLNKYAPEDWRERCSIIECEYPYDQRIDTDLYGIGLDPIYEAKAAEYLRSNDLFWIIGCRELEEK